AVAAPARPLELDPAALGAQRGHQPPAEALSLVENAGLAPPREQPVAGTAREADEPGRVLLELVQRDPWGGGLARARACVRVRVRHEAAEVAVAVPVLCEESEVGAVREAELG